MSDRPVVFFDRDGVINTAPSAEEYYVLSPDRLFLEPGFFEALHVVTNRGWDAVVITNQYAIGRGLLTEKGLEAIHQKLIQALAVEGLALAAIYHCPHGGDHPWRKPNPGMFFQAAEDLDLDLGTSWMIGDSPRDIKAADRAGCGTSVFIGAQSDTGATHTIGTINELFDLLADQLAKPN